MTFEQYKSLAKTPTLCSETCVYKVMIWVYSKKDSYPEFEIKLNQVSYHLSFNDGKDAIRQITKDHIEDTAIYGSYITQHIIGRIGTPNDYEKIWVFDSMGILIDESYCPQKESNNQFPFRGRSGDKIRFKKGDIVEIADLKNKRVHLAVVSDLPISIERAWEINLIAYRKKFGNSDFIESIDENFSFFDSSDDCYIVSFINGNCNIDKKITVHSTCIFPVHKEIPEYIKEIFQTRFSYLKENNNNNSVNTHTSINEKKINIINPNNSTDNFSENSKIPFIQSPDEVKKLMEDLWINHKAGNKTLKNNVFMVKLPS